VIFTIARATGWSEDTIIWMPLKRTLQYLHAAWVSEGIKTTWRHQSGEGEAEENALYQRLKYLTRHG
jgi:hypothetical protein